MKIRTLIVLAITIAALAVLLSSKSKKKEKWNIKKFENSFVHIAAPANIYAYKTEVTNKEYRTFLQELKQAGKTDMYNLCLYDSAQWKEMFAYSYNEPMVEHYHWHPAYDLYPIVNISHQAAQEYCSWLTEKYNSNPRRKYQKVTFYLPSKLDWIMAASAFTDGHLPWYGDKAYDVKGQYLCNVKHRDYRQANGKIIDIATPTDSIKKSHLTVKKAKTESEEVETGYITDYVCDGGFHTIITAHYPPNRLGLYDMVGNAAEMIDRDSISMGGHWHSFIEDCYIDKQLKYEGANPLTGFRVFMSIDEK